VGGHYEAWVGKSSAENDLLTTKHAGPHDFWFHVRGTSGSHVVLKGRPGGTSVPPKEVIHAAARIAAYYSKMRKSGNVPVAYCERKYVKKPKNAPPGTVTLQREEIVFVSPGIP
ncbi:MAG TPA: NFACT RNA binding domain-containing protein, partial [Bacteroidota bacterium]|nr:NFACT RNA binding domain-containing protein [Bacteroidota bacterium]